MEKNKKRILSTRPVGKALIDEASRHNIILDEISFIETEELMDKITEQKIERLSDENITAVFTSMKAVLAVKRFIKNDTSWKIFCIGNTTRKLAEGIFGTGNITGIADSADHLAEKIIEHPGDTGKVYFFCGDKRREELPQKLKNNQVEIEELVVYKTIETSRLISQEYHGILFFSPSAVHSFFLKNSVTENLQFFAIGETTANAIKHFTQHPVIVAEIPDKKKLVAQAIEHFSST